MQAACTETGRDPSSLARTVGVTLAFPDLVDRQPAAALTGTTEQLAESLQGYADLGVSEVIVDVNPYTPKALDRFSPAVSLFRQQVRV
jgi:hypothetical protein